MSNIFKKNITILIVLLMLISITACSGGNEESEAGNLPKKINVGIMRIANDEMIAIGEGLFEKYFEDRGIEVNHIVFDSGAEANQALASGSIDFAAMGNVNSVVSLTRDLGVELIWIHDILGESECLVAREGSGIEEVKDLVGKKVATPFASTCHYLLLNLLQEEEIEDDIQLLDMQTTEIVAAWERGDIDAAYSWQPTLDNLLETGNILVSSADLLERGYITADVGVVRKEFSSKYPELVVDFIAVLEEGKQIYLNEPDRAGDIVAGELEIPKEDVLRQMAGFIMVPAEELVKDQYMGTSENPGNFTKVMKSTGDFLLEQNSIEHSPSQEEFNEFVNPKYIEMYLEREGN